MKVLDCYSCPVLDYCCSCPLEAAVLDCSFPLKAVGLDYFCSCPSAVAGLDYCSCPSTGAAPGCCSYPSKAVVLDCYCSCPTEAAGPGCPWAWAPSTCLRPEPGRCLAGGCHWWAVPTWSLLWNPCHRARTCQKSWAATAWAAGIGHLHLASVAEGRRTWTQRLLK